MLPLATYRQWLHNFSYSLARAQHCIDSHSYVKDIEKEYFEAESKHWNIQIKDSMEF